MESHIKRLNVKEEAEEQFQNKRAFHLQFYQHSSCHLTDHHCLGHCDLDDLWTCLQPVFFRMLSELKLFCDEIKSQTMNVCDVLSKKNVYVCVLPQRSSVFSVIRTEAESEEMMSNNRRSSSETGLVFRI